MCKKISVALFLGILALFVYTCKSERGQIVKNWEIGISTTNFDEISQEVLEELKRNSIKYVELGTEVTKNKTVEEIEDWVRNFKQKANKTGIEVWSVHLPYSKALDISSINQEERQNIIQRHKQLMALLEPLGVQKYVIHPSACPIEDEERIVRIEKSIASLKILTEEVKKYDAQLTLEVMPRTCLGNTSEEMLKIVNAVGNELEVCFDSNHLLQETPEQFVAQVGDLITTVHISDYDGIDEKHWLPDKEGIINWNNVIKELVNIGYKGPWMYEVPKGGGRGRNENYTVNDFINNWQKLKTDYLNLVKE